MADTFSKTERTKTMSAVKSADTKPEILVRRYLFAQGLRFRKNVSNLPGKPDVVLPKFKTIIFIHGCFWHGHAICGKTIPESNKQYWTGKISRNIQRDKDNKATLKKMGWRVITIWECQLKNKEVLKQSLSSLLKQITG
ncbi:very short patch repair endonuclease [Niabella hirudinis]|uniref:very short patch repair endonuclease n=1 Tax=Niabella hirudinis TaxID=1285929 RepID=UPI003EBFD6F5